MNTRPSPRSDARRRAAAAGLLAVALAAPAMAQYSTPAATDTVKTRLILRTFTDFGHIVEGSNPTANDAAGVRPELSMQPLNRANFMAIQEVASGNFDVAAGLSGLIWWPYGGGVTDANERVMNVKPMVPVARVRWRFGDPTATSGALLLGTFNHKYNPDAKNLGEYLYRSGTYPGFLFTTEGWLLMNRAGYYAHGALLSIAQMNGALRHNFSLFMETSYYPVGDFSPGYDVTYGNKRFEVGGGVVLNHFLPLRPSALRPKKDENILIEAVDTATGDRYVGPKDRLTLFTPDVETRELHRWTHKGVKAMARAAINVNALLGVLPPERSNAEDLRIFGEVAVLGWKDQPLYYEERSERMPIMFGINVPTFKTLDVLTLQVEHYASPFSNMGKFNAASLPIWGDELALDSTGAAPALDAQGRVILPSNHADDWKWSVYAKKTVNRAVTLHAQAASDHLRLTDGKFNMSSVPLTNAKNEWYYLLRLEFALR